MTVRTLWSLPSCRPSTIAFLHMCRGPTSSWIRTTSPSRMPRHFCGFRNSWKFFNWSRYYFCQGFQKSSDSFNFNRNSLARSFLVSGSGPIGVMRRPPPIKKCAGVRASESPLYVMGLEFTAASMLISVVLSCSSVRLDCPSTLQRQRFTVSTIHSHQPPHHAARGAMIFQATPFWARNWWDLQQDRTCQISVRSRFAAWNVLALSE